MIQKRVLSVSETLAIPGVVWAMQFINNEKLLFIYLFIFCAFFAKAYPQSGTYIALELLACAKMYQRGSFIALLWPAMSIDTALWMVKPHNSYDDPPTST